MPASRLPVSRRSASSSTQPIAVCEPSGLSGHCDGLSMTSIGCNSESKVNDFTSICSDKSASAGMAASRLARIESQRLLSAAASATCMLRDWSASSKSVAGFRVIVVHTSVGRSMASTVSSTIASRIPTSTRRRAARHPALPRPERQQRKQRRSRQRDQKIPADRCEDESKHEGGKVLNFAKGKISKRNYER